MRPGGIGGWFVPVKFPTWECLRRKPSLVPLGSLGEAGTRSGTQSQDCLRWESPDFRRGRMSRKSVWSCRSRSRGRGGWKMNTTVQKAIHDGMKATGITQTELAVVLRSRARASEIINGKRDLRRIELLVLSYLLHIPLETLMPPLSEEDKLHIDSLIAWERKLQETRYIKKRASKRSKKSCPKN